MLPRFEIVTRLRPVALRREGEVVAPYATVTGPGTVALRSGEDVIEGYAEAGEVGVRVTAGGVTSRHQSRRHGRLETAPDEVAVTLTGWQACVWVRTGDDWVIRGRVGLKDRIDVHDEAWCRGLRAEGGRLGPFGQLGLRDTRVVISRDGEPVRDGDAILLTATHAGPGFADAAHTGVWAFDPHTMSLEHRGDLFFRRPDKPGVFGDHATHLVRDGSGWLVATSTWGDFDRRPGQLRVTLARSDDDLTRGTHVLDSRELALPTAGLRSVATWDPHLVHDGHRWLAAYVSATKFFRFHPALAAGRDLDDLTLIGAATDRRATEGPTLLRLGEQWRVVASDGRDGRRGQREQMPVFDLSLCELGALDAPYPTNIPWPTLVRDGDEWLMLSFNGAEYGGPLAGYGTHGQVVVMRGQAER